MSESPASYFKRYRAEIGFSNQGDAKKFLSGKDVLPSVDLQYIDELNARIKKIIERINEVVDESYKRKDVGAFADEFIFRAYKIIKSADLLPRLNNQGRRTEGVLFSWLRGYAISEFFTPAFSKLFSVNIDSITRIGDDDLSDIETFKRTPKADLEIEKNGKKFRIEVQSGFQGVNDIKEHKVREARRVFADNATRTICIHIDLFNGQVAFVQIDRVEDDNLNWVTRQQMEGQSVFAIDQNYFKWRLLDKLPLFRELEVEL